MKKLITIPLLFVLSVNAQELKQDISEILNTNPTILERLKNYNATKEDITNAKAGFYPKLDLSLGMGVENTQKSEQANSAPDVSTNFSTYQNSLKLTQNLFDGFKTTSLISEQKLRTLSASYSYVEKVNDISLEYASAYLNVLKNSEILETAKENVAIDEDIYSKVQKLYKSGLTTLSEVNKVEASLAQARANLVIKENSLLNARYNLQKLLGRNSNVEQMQKPDINITLPSSMQEALKYSLTHNPTLLVAAHNTQLAQATYREKKAPFYPQVDVEITQSFNKNTSAIEAKTDSFQAMAYIRYNLFNGFADKASLQKSLSQIHQEVASSNRLKREIIETLSISWTSYEKLSKQLVYLKDYKKFSNKTLSLYKKEYDLGRRSLLDLLSAQSDFIGAKSQIIETEYTILSSQYEILDAMGLLVSTILGSCSEVSSKVGIQGSQALTPQDTLPIRLDRDKDLIPDAIDICDNSLSSSMKNIYGCAFTDKNISSIERYDNFFFNKDINATLNETSQVRAQNLIKQLTPYGFENMQVTLLVNTFDSNTSSENIANLSKAKAKTFEEFLVESGFDVAHINTVFHADTAPMFIEDEEKNGRIDVIVYKYFKNDDLNETLKKEEKE